MVLFPWLLWFCTTSSSDNFKFFTHANWEIVASVFFYRWIIRSERISAYLGIYIIYVIDTHLNLNFYDSDGKLSTDAAVLAV
jgi:hypothetical protein